MNKRKSATSAVGGTPPPRAAVTTSTLAPVGGGMAMSMPSTPPQGHETPQQAIAKATWAPRRALGRGTMGWSAPSSSPWSLLRGVGSLPPPRKHPPTTVSTPYGDADPALPGAAWPKETLWGGHRRADTPTWSPDPGKRLPCELLNTLCTGKTRWYNLLLQNRTRPPEDGVSRTGSHRPRDAMSRANTSVHRDAHPDHACDRPHIGGVRRGDTGCASSTAATPSMHGEVHHAHSDVRPMHDRVWRCEGGVRTRFTTRSRRA